MVMLEPYQPAHEAATLRRIAEFFGFHQALVAGPPQGNAPRSNHDDNSPATLAEWLVHPHALFVILSGGASVGFIHLHFRGPSVAWIEDVFVDAEQRGQGIASSAIAAAEAIVMNTPGYTAVCLDVSPRNSGALRLYHKLGYTDLSLVTVRKELGESKRDKPLQLLGLDFNY